jgi:aryl-alcohol dehydrogenase-like predicted oxidoreductase
MRMLYKTIPGTELRVSAICLGSATFGSEIPTDEAMRTMDAFSAAGGNFIDSARVYADWLPGGHGASETTIGNWLLRQADRRSFILATKGGHPDLKTMSISRMTPADVAADIAESQRCLKTDYIDLYWLHRDDTARPVGEIIDMMEEFVANGWIRYYGCSNWTPTRIQAALDYARSRGLRGFVADQPLWSLAQWNPGSIGDPTLVAMTPELYRLHRTTGLAAIPYSSQAKGFFTKVLRDGDSLAKGMRRRYWNDENLARAKRVASLAGELGVPVAAIPLAWLMNQPFTTIPIIGPRNAGQLVESLAAADLALPAAVVEDIGKVL